jgi:hypothetical protein
MALQVGDQSPRFYVIQLRPERSMRYQIIKVKKLVVHFLPIGIYRRVHSTACAP